MCFTAVDADFVAPCGLNAFRDASGGCSCLAPNVPVGDGMNCCRPNAVFQGGTCVCKAQFTWNPVTLTCGEPARELLADDELSLYSPACETTCPVPHYDTDAFCESGCSR